jgi:5-formyltetrahydrofolate cyclo-ligase
MHIADEKKRLRQAIAERLAKLSDKDRVSDSRSTCKHILKEMKDGPITVAVYYPMKSEVDIRPLIETLLARGANVFMPRAKGNGFEFCRVTSLASLVPGPFGILEPRETEDVLDKATLDYVLVPGVAFDRNGNRIGRGNGGYDKWLSKVRSVNKTVKVWGVAFDIQITHSIPLEPHDLPMDAVFTARGLINANER